MFKHCGQLLFPPGTDEERLMEAALELGADDILTDDEGGIEVVCNPPDFPNLKEALEKSGFVAEMAEIIMKPDTETLFTGENAIKMQKLLDALENIDDVQEIYTNAVINQDE
jgi:transcriptional/translational regulatory protein YebC/TACO1